MSAGFLDDIRKLADDIVGREGCYLYDLEFVGAGAGRTLRVTIDKELDGGASIEDCSKISRGLNQALDEVEDEIPGGNYNLEVSTPGLERVLKEPRHFEKAIGKKISVKTFAPLVQFNESLPELGKAKQVQGQLVSFDEAGLKVSLGSESETESEDETLEAESPVPIVFVPFDTVTKAHMVFEFKEPQAKKKPSGQKKKKKKPKK